MTREADSIALEADYWRAVLGDVLEVNDRIGIVAQQLSAVASAEIRLLRTVPRRSPEMSALTDATRHALNELPQIQNAIERITKLADGRHRAIQQERDE